MGRLIALTATKIGAEVLSTPRVVYVNDSFIIVTPGQNGFTKVVESDNGRTKTFLVLESALEIEAARNPSSTDIYLRGKINTELTATGANQGAALALTKYLNEVDDGTATSADGVKLVAAVKGVVQVVINNATFALDVWPNTGDSIGSGAANAGTTLAAGKRAHYVCLANGKWTLAEDFGQ